RPWVPVNSKFSAPSGVEFSDMTPMFEQKMQGQESGNMPSQGDLCAMCGSIPDADAKSDCLADC
ncbi:MAG: hypothetical protein ACE5DM_05275, partial [Candidatus Nanoarchaeia archaeon]